MGLSLCSLAYTDEAGTSIGIGSPIHSAKTPAMNPGESRRSLSVLAGGWTPTAPAYFPQPLLPHPLFQSRRLLSSPLLA